MARFQRILFAVAIALAASAWRADAQTCTGPVCNATHSGCTYVQSSTDRPCCCNVHCNGDGCTCTTKCQTGCQFTCPSCSTCTTGPVGSVVPFKVPQTAVDQLAKDFPIAEMILANVSDDYKNPIYTNRVAGGTTLVNGPRGYRYKGMLSSSANGLTLDLVFIPIPPNERGADGEAEAGSPPQKDQPAPPPTRIQIDAAGAIAMSSLAADVSESIRTYEPPKCDQKATKAKTVAGRSGEMSVPLFSVAAKK
jgi:hypothetical protein